LVMIDRGVSKGSHFVSGIMGHLCIG
jgi:hypothetical protein